MAKIEDAIKQTKPFKDVRQKAVVNIIYTHNWISDKFKKFLAPFNITPTQYNVLRILRGAGKPISTSDIRDRMLEPSSDTSRIVDRLAKCELVERRVCPNDKRLVDVSISAKGLELLQDMDNDALKIGYLMGKLTEAEAIQLSELLDKIRSCGECDGAQH